MCVHVCVGEGRRGLVATTDLEHAHILTLTAILEHSMLSKINLSRLCFSVNSETAYSFDHLSSSVLVCSQRLMMSVDLNRWVVPNI